MTTRMYVKHRKNQRDWILSVAEELFIERGIEKVTIEDIATATRLTRATLYRYFPGKEQIAHEIFRAITKSWAERTQREVWNQPGDGYTQIQRFLFSQLNYMLSSPREVRFISEFNYLYAKEWPVEVMVQLLSENLDEDRQRLLDCIRQGQADGSIRKDSDPKIILAAIFNFSSAMLSRVGEMGDKIASEYGLSLSVILHQIYRIFLDGLRPTSALEGGLADAER